MTRRPIRSTALLVATLLSAGRGDEPLHQYEGDVLPYALGAGWVINRRCEGGCSESLEDGHLVVTYVSGAYWYNYDRLIARIIDPQPPTLWVEWGFRSEQPLSGFKYGCDGRIAVQHQHWFDLAYIFGDAAVSFSGDDVVWGLDMDLFHTYRFESIDGVHYRISADGLVFRESYDDQVIGGAFVQFGGDGGCGPEYLPTVNEWDFVRYGTVGYGEQIVSSDPPAGFVDARVYPMIDRFTVTYDEPNYVYIDEITIETTPLSSPLDKGGGVGTAIAIPAVIGTRRLDNGPPETVEIVLDRSIPYNATTRFTCNDGVAVQSVEFTYAPGDTDSDGDADLLDFAAFQNCFGNSPVAGVCLSLDFNSNQYIDLLDFAAFQAFFRIP